MKPQHYFDRLPRLCFVGPMVGRNPGYVTTQGELLSDHFAGRGYCVLSVSSSPSRFGRLTDIVSTLIRYGRSIEILVIQVYGERSFIIEDVASWLGERFKHRIVMVLRGGGMPAFMKRFPGWSRRVLSRAHAIVTPSEFLARAITPYGFRAKVIPNLIDISAYPYRQRHSIKPHLFWMRSFHEVYNPLMAIRVLAGLRTKRPQASLVMAGQDKGLERETKRLAEKLGLNGAVRFPGFLDMAAKVREGDAADIYVNTNRVDNMPVAVIEACAMGLPVVGTSVGGIPYLLNDGENALLVPSDDGEAMVSAIERLLQDPKLAARLSSNGRRLAENSSCETVISQWEQLFAEVRNCDTV